MLRDARLYQILFLSLFLLLGIGTRDWTLQPQIVLTAIATCLTTQLVAERILMKAERRSQAAQSVSQRELETRSQEEKAKESSQESGANLFKVAADGSQEPIFFLRPASAPSPTRPPSLPPTTLLSPLITSLGLSLLLRTDHITTMMLASAIAILSKFLLRVNGKHLFNPANIGIVTAIVLTHDAWVSPGQWGESSWYALVFLGAGGIVLQKVGRWDTTIAFLTSYGLFEALRNVWLGWTWDVWVHRLMSGSLLLFALFMVTDPRTIPNERTARIIWAIAIAGLTFVLRNVYFVSTAVFWALFALSPLTLVLDAIWQAPQFNWADRQLQTLKFLKNSDVSSS